jgi:hypothetical protein
MLWDDDTWFPRAIASVGEGFCPEHMEPLGSFRDRPGWCTYCEAWWWIDRERCFEHMCDGPYVCKTLPVGDVDSLLYGAAT